MHFVIQKRQLSSVYAEWLDDYADIRFFSEPAKARSNYWLNAIFLPNKESRDDLLKRANECGVMTRPMWTPMTTLAMYKHCQQYGLVNTFQIEDTLVNIPSSAVGQR